MPNPNILFIMSDDQGPWAMHCAGNDEIITPNLDRLAAEGVRFDNMYCVSPVCSPARASVLTGTIPSVHGVHDWLRRGNYDGKKHPEVNSPDETAIRYLDGLTGYTDILAREGYSCAFSGKWHMGDSETPQHGFTLWYTLTSGGCNYYHPPFFENGKIVDKNAYVTDVITDHALQFLDELCGEDAPFYLSVCYTSPHSPWEYSQHPEEIRALYRNCPFKSTPDMPEHPWQIESAPKPDGDPARRRELLTGYFSAVTAMDRNIGRLLEALESRGVLEDTLIVFTGDNGMNMGHHGIYGKGNGTFPQNMYDESVKVPFIMRWPGHLPQGRICSHMISHYDFYPTLLELLGLPVTSVQPLPGRSRLNVILDPSLPDEGEVVVFDEYGPVRMIRTRKWKYVHRNPYGPHELYDMENDPGETVNLSGEPAYAAVEGDLRQRLAVWFLTYADPARDGSREPVYGEGQLDRAGTGALGRINYLHTPEMHNPQ